MTIFARRFVLEREIGSGGMARVFLGRDEVLERPVAIKFLKPGYDDTDIAARFRREGRTAAALSHPNIIQVYDAGEDEMDGQKVSYIVMEYLTGGDLKGLIDRRGFVPADELCRLGEGVCAGLAHAHERGVIHRDIKPHNILLSGDGRPKLTDFGIARALEATRVTRTGSFLGTVLYAPPEQLRADRITPRSDVYSLGATLYQAATGDPPFSGMPMAVAQLHMTQMPPPPRQKNGEVPPDLEALIMACLSKDPAERPTAGEIRSRLAAMSGRQAYAPPPASERTSRTRVAPQPPAGSRRRRAGGFLAPLALVALLALIGAIAAPAFLDEDAGRVSAPPPSNEDQNARSGRNGGQPAQPPRQTAAERAAPEEEAGRLTEQAAANAVETFYTSAAEGDYERSSGLLSSSYRQSTFPSRATFESTFDTLQSIRFVEGPDAQISGDTATVTGVTLAEHTGRTERNTASWTLVSEGGEWRLDGISVQQQEVK